MKASRSMLMRPFQTVTSGPGSGSSATQPTPAQRLKSTEMSSPAAVILTRQSPSSAPSSRNILASSSKLKTGSAASPQERLVVNTSNRPRSSFTISQNCLGARFLMGGLLSPTQLFRLHGCFAYSGVRGQNRWPQHPEPFRHLNAPVVPLIYLLPYPKAHRFSSVFDIDDAHNLGDRAVFSDHREQLLTLPDADDGSVVGPRSVYALRFTLKTPSCCGSSQWLCPRSLPNSSPSPPQTPVFGGPGTSRRSPKAAGAAAPPTDPPTRARDLYGRSCHPWSRIPRSPWRGPSGDSDEPWPNPSANPCDPRTGAGSSRCMTRARPAGNHRGWARRPCPHAHRLVGHQGVGVGRHLGTQRGPRARHHPVVFRVYHPCSLPCLPLLNVLESSSLLPQRWALAFLEAPKRVSNDLSDRTRPSVLFGDLTTRTGQWAWRTTQSETLPVRALRISPQPRFPPTIRYAPSSSASATIPSAGWSPLKWISATMPPASLTFLTCSSSNSRASQIGRASCRER